MTMVPGIQMCSAIEFNGIFNNAANTISNFTFNCMNTAAPAKWAANLTACLGAGVQGCGPGACCATRNGSLFGWAMISSQVCQPGISGPQLMYGYATPFDLEVNYGWGEIDSNCNLAVAQVSLARALRNGMALIAAMGFMALF